MVISDAMFRDLLDWFMVSDPWPLDQAAHTRLHLALDEASKLRGYENWVVAYHEMPRSTAS